jgi:hypothetical protein
MVLHVGNPDAAIGQDSDTLRQRKTATKGARRAPQARRHEGIGANRVGRSGGPLHDQDAMVFRVHNQQVGRRAARRRCRCRPAWAGKERQAIEQWAERPDARARRGIQHTHHGARQGQNLDAAISSVGHNQVARRGDRQGARVVELARGAPGPPQVAYQGPIARAVHRQPVIARVGYDNQRAIRVGIPRHHGHARGQFELPRSAAFGPQRVHHRVLERAFKDHDDMPARVGDKDSARPGNRGRSHSHGHGRIEGAAEKRPLQPTEKDKSVDCWEQLVSNTVATQKQT